MSSNVIPHPYHDLMAEAKRERKIVDSAEAEVLRDRIFDAFDAYSQFLERHDLIWGDGALDRVYGNRRNPDYEGGGPPDIPHRLRSDD